MFLHRNPIISKTTDTTFIIYSTKITNIAFAINTMYYSTTWVSVNDISKDNSEYRKQNLCL